MTDAIGGYFELEHPAQPQTSPHEGALRVQSARAALGLLLHGLRPSAIWAPKYICASMLTPARTLGIPLKFYDLAPDLSLARPPPLGKTEVLLYVNYFGVSAAHVDRLLGLVDPQQVIIDSAQAFYEPLRPCLATIYSPRKFFGLPDGGLLAASRPVPPPAQADKGSLDRMGHLLARAQGDLDRGFALFQAAEASLEDTTPMGMSVLTQRLFDSVDFEGARRRRHGNFRYLHEQLGGLNRLKIACPSAAAPLCYPFWPANPVDRAALWSQRVYVPRYWAEVESLAEVGSVERACAEQCLPLPCDQRYTPAELGRVVAIVRGLSETR